MSDKVAKAEINIGALSFKGEGDQQWLSEQIAKFVEVATVSGISHRHQESAKLRADDHLTGEFKTSLAAYLKEKNAQTKQVERFLATARWLMLRGTTELSTSAVAKALAEHRQSKLSNPSDCLGQNITKGYCEKVANGFFITPDGLKALGEE